MNIWRTLVDTVTVFSVTLITSIIVNVLWSLVVHGTKLIDWETSIRLAILFSVVVPWVRTRKG